MNTLRVQSEGTDPSLHIRDFIYLPLFPNHFSSHPTLLLKYRPKPGAGWYTNFGVWGTLEHKRLTSAPNFSSIGFGGGAHVSPAPPRVF